MKDRKVAIITGSSTGVGAATAMQLAERGWNVVINYAHSRQEAESTAQQCREAGAEVLLIQADVSSDTACRDLVYEVYHAWGRIDALVNNAGTTKFCAYDNLEGLSALGPEIRVNAVCPGFIQGRWTQGFLGDRYEEVNQQFAESATLQKTALPADVAEVIVFLITGARLMTGEIMIVDGGSTLKQVTLGRK